MSGEEFEDPSDHSEEITSGDALVDGKPNGLEVRVHLPEGCLPSIGTVQGASVTFGVFADAQGHHVGVAAN